MSGVLSSLRGGSGAPDSPETSPSAAVVVTGVHPLAWVAGLLMVSAGFFQLVGTKYLIGNLAWWHWVFLVVVMAMSFAPITLHRLRVAVEILPAITGTAAWILAWVVFFVQLFNVVTRYGNDLVDQDILIGQATSGAWQSFALLFLLGINYGVKAEVNPRIDFWWADFSDVRKAWLDFVLHIMLLLPFIIMAIRILRPYAAISLGRRRDGTWPSGWRVWNTWENSPDADQLGVGPVKAMLLVAFVLFGIQIMAEVIKTGFVIMGRSDLGDVQDHDAPLRVE